MKFLRFDNAAFINKTPINSCRMVPATQQEGAERGCFFEQLAGEADPAPTMRLPASPAALSLQLDPSHHQQLTKAALRSCLPFCLL